MILLLWLLACAAVDTSAPYAGVLVALDVDRDGRVGETEYAAAAPPVAPSFAEADRDGDGNLDREEAAALARRIDPANFDPGLVPAPADSRRQAGAPPGKKPRRSKRAEPHDEPADPNAPGSGFDGSGPPLVGGAITEAAPGPKPAHAPAPPGPGGGPTVGNSDLRSHEAELFREAVAFFGEELRVRDGAARLPDGPAITAAMKAGPGSEERRVVLADLRAEAARVGLAWPASLNP